jgi:hypothetical protein
MSDTFSDRAHALRQRARQEHDRGRQRYLIGLAAAYDGLAHRQGEPAPPARPPRPQPPEIPERAKRAAALRDQGLSQRQVAQAMNCSQQLISKILLGG